MIVKAVELPQLIIKSCLSLHRDLGHGLPEWVYRDCLSREMKEHGLFYQRDVSSPAPGGTESVVIDFVVENSVAVLIRNGFAAAKAEKDTLNEVLANAGLAAGLVFNFNELDLNKGTWQTVLETRKTEFWY